VCGYNITELQTIPATHTYRNRQAALFTFAKYKVVPRRTIVECQVQLAVSIRGEHIHTSQVAYQVWPELVQQGRQLFLKYFKIISAASTIWMVS
jgi:hypothetical protein